MNVTLKRGMKRPYEAPASIAVAVTACCMVDLSMGSAVEATPDGDIDAKENMDTDWDEE